MEAAASQVSIAPYHMCSEDDISEASVGYISLPTSSFFATPRPFSAAICESCEEFVLNFCWYVVLESDPETQSLTHLGHRCWRSYQHIKGSALSCAFCDRLWSGIRRLHLASGNIRIDTQSEITVDWAEPPLRDGTVDVLVTTRD